MSGNFEWKENYSIGIEEIDYQHKRFLALIKKLYDLHKADTDISTVFEAIRELERYLLFHTRSEEFMMELYAYPKLHEQKVEHARIIHVVQAEINKISDNPERLSVLLTILTEWLTNHSTTLDKDFGAHVQQQRGGSQNEPGLG